MNAYNIVCGLTVIYCVLEDVYLMVSPFRVWLFASNEAFQLA